MGRAAPVSDTTQMLAYLAFCCTLVSTAVWLDPATHTLVRRELGD